MISFILIIVAFLVGLILGWYLTLRAGFALRQPEDSRSFPKLGAPFSHEEADLKKRKEVM